MSSFDHKLGRLKCDKCGRVSDWELLPPGVFPTPKGWHMNKNAQLCGPCFMTSTKRGTARDYFAYLAERVRQLRQGFAEK